MQNANWGRTRRACYYTNIVMASAFSLPPMLFGAFHSTYGISYTLLGTLVLVNFFTQMLIDLVLTFFGRYFPNKTVVRCMPLLTAAGLLVYAAVPTLFPEHAYAGLVCGTVIFSVAAGCCEVLLSPVIAAMPSDDPGRDMSRLHSLYGYGVLLVVAISALYFQVFGTENWAYLATFFALLPVLGSVLLFLSPMPEIELGSEKGEKRSRKHVRELVFCAVFIFFGGVAECTMTNWVCVYLEKALSLPKAASDMLGLAAFAALLALTRTLYAKYGRRISKVLGWSMVGGVCCYLVAGLALNPVVAVVACMLTGVCTGMLWPGTLILMEEKIPNPGVAAYALMAAGGDFGASIAPQLMGVVVDRVTVSDWGIALAQTLALSPEQLGMKTGMVISALFPLIGIGVLIGIGRYFADRKA